MDTREAFPLADVVIHLANGGTDRYPLPEELTYGELRAIKNGTGLMPGDLDDALAGGDGGLIIALAAIAAGRVGTTLDTAALEALSYGSITVEDDDPPTSAAAAATEQPAATTPEPGGNQS